MITAEDTHQHLQVSVSSSPPDNCSEEHTADQSQAHPSAPDWAFVAENATAENKLNS